MKRAELALALALLSLVKCPMATDLAGRVVTKSESGPATTKWTMPIAIASHPKLIKVAADKLKGE